MGRTDRAEMHAAGCKSSPMTQPRLIPLGEFFDNPERALAKLGLLKANGKKGRSAGYQLP